MELFDLGMLAPMVAIRVMVEVRDLHHQVGLVMGINLMYYMSILIVSVKFNLNFPAKTFLFTLRLRDFVYMQSFAARSAARKTNRRFLC